MDQRDREDDNMELMNSGTSIYTHLLESRMNLDLVYTWRHTCMLEKMLQVVNLEIGNPCAHDCTIALASHG